MSCRPTSIPIKFSNLLQTNPQSTLYGFDIKINNNLQNDITFYQRIKHRSVNLGSLKSKKQEEEQSPQIKTIELQTIINKTKINRLLMNANLNQSDLQDNNKKKKSYVIRRRDQKSKTIRQRLKQINKMTTKYHSKQLQKGYRQLQRGQRQLQKGQRQLQKGYRIRTQPSVNKYQQIFNIKRKIPKFGIEDLAPQIALRKQSLNIQKAAQLFSSTLSHTFYNTTLRISSKKKQQSCQTKQQTDKILNPFSPKIENLTPNPIHNLNSKEKKKKIQTFYATKNNLFTFTRSKTQEFQQNFICAWEKQSQIQFQGLG